MADDGFDAVANGAVYSLAVQTNGQILVAGAFTNLAGQPRNYLGRLNVDGSLDTSFTNGVDGGGYTLTSLALQPDGKILVGGAFTTLAGQARSRLGRLSTDTAAIQNLRATTNSVTWERSGAGPEVWRTTFEQSSNGVDWIDLGAGARMTGGWQVTNLTLPTGTNFYVRARGFARGGIENASESIIESVRLVYFKVSSSISAVIVDNADATGVEIVGTWINSTSTLGYWRTNYLHDGNIGKGTKSVTFRPNLPSAGDYEVSIWYSELSNRATNVPVDIMYGGGSQTVLVNQRTNGSKWVVLGTNSFAAGTNGYVRVRNAGTADNVIADAVRFKYVGQPALEILTSTNAVTVPEGGIADFQIKLNTAPDSSKTVTVSRVSGDTDITVQSGGSLVFSATNWNINQTVILSAAEDLDTVNSAAIIWCSAFGLASTEVTATEQDNDSTSTNAAVIVDNADATGVEIVGTWTGSTSTPGYWRTNYLHDGNTGKGSKSVTFRPNLPSTGDYEVSIWYPAFTNRATDVLVDIVYSGGSNTVVVNQRVNGGQWVVLGTNKFAAGMNGYVKIRNDGTTSGYVIADAVKFKAAGVSPTPVVTVQASDALAGEPGSGEGTGTFTFSRTEPTTAALTVNFTVGGTATSDSDYTSIGTTVSFAPGSATTTKTISVINDTVEEEDKTVVVMLASGTGYTVGSPSLATVTIKDDESSSPELIVDNSDATGVEIAGTWTGSTSNPGYWLTNYLHDGNTGKGTKSVTFRPNLTQAGDYEVSIRYTADPNRAMNVPVDIVYVNGTNTVVVNQRVNGGQWVVLGTNTFARGTNGYVKIRTGGTTSGYVVADAVKFLKVGGMVAPSIAQLGERADTGAMGESWPQLWTSGDYSDEFSASNLIDGNTNTMWIGNVGGEPWRVILDLGVVTDVTGIYVMFQDTAWTNKEIIGSRDSEVWFDYLADTNEWVSLRYLYLNFGGDEHGAKPPAIREIIWRDR